MQHNTITIYAECQHTARAKYRICYIIYAESFSKRSNGSVFESLLCIRGVSLRSRYNNLSQSKILTVSGSICQSLAVSGILLKPGPQRHGNVVFTFP